MSVGLATAKRSGIFGTERKSTASCSGMPYLPPLTGPWVSGQNRIMHQSVTFPQRSLQCRPGVRRARTHPPSRVLVSRMFAGSPRMSLG